MINRMCSGYGLCPELDLCPYMARFSGTPVLTVTWKLSYQAFGQRMMDRQNPQVCLLFFCDCNSSMKIWREQRACLFKMNFSVFRTVQPSNYRTALLPYYVPQSLAQPVDLPVVLDHLFISLCVCVLCSAGECAVLCTWRSEGSFVRTLLSLA